MKQVNIYEAKTHFSRLVAEALQGEDIVIARDGVPFIRFVPIVPPTKAGILGLFRGKIQISEDFDEPLSDFDPYQ
jgi:antitoxin (DNA-binding transcriptional repressor) of toxin-antitoxin stability system